MWEYNDTFSLAKNKFESTLAKMLKQFFLIFALIGVLLQNFSKIIIYVNFTLNRDYIAKNLCVKKSEPDNCCKGSCHLQKELDKEEKKEQAPVNPIKNKSEIQLISQNNSGIYIFSYPDINDLISYYPFDLTKKNAPSIFRPPKHFLQNRITIANFLTGRAFAYS